MQAKRRHLLVALGGGIVLVGALAVAFGGRKDESDRFGWDGVSRGDIRETLTASGEIQSRTKVNVGTSVMGEIKILHVRDGQDVKAGDPLVTIDPERLKQELVRAEAMLDGQRQEAARLEAIAKRGQDTFQRQETLFRQGLLAEEDYRQAKLQLESSGLSFASAKSQVQQGQANLAAMRDALSKTTLRAPISGRVTGLKAEKGETAIPGQSNVAGAMLMVISDMRELVAEIKVNESEVVKTRVGQSGQVVVESLPGRVFPGRVFEVATAAERFGQDANMYLVKVAVDMSAPDAEKLRPGMSARAVVLTSEARGVLRVPLQAVLEREGSLEEAQKKGLLAPEARSIVFVPKEGRATERTVRTGIANTQFLEVKEGLSEGEKVLTGPIRRLKELKDRAVAKLRSKSDQELEEEAKRRKDKKP